MGCVEGQPQEKKEQTKKELGFSEKSPRGTRRELLHANVSPSMLISCAAPGFVSHKRDSRCAPGFPGP